MIDNKDMPLISKWVESFPVVEKVVPSRANNIIGGWCTKNNKVPYVIINSKGCVIGLAGPSGGYPCVPDSFTQWHTWNNYEEAERYRLMFDFPGGHNYGCALPWKVVTLYEALGIEE